MSPADWQAGGESGQAHADEGVGRNTREAGGWRHKGKHRGDGAHRSDGQRMGTGGSERGWGIVPPLPPPPPPRAPTQKEYHPPNGRGINPS